MRLMIAAALSASVLLAGCATGPQGAEVTRFHLGQPIARSTVALVPGPGLPPGLEFGAYADAVARELAAQNFVPSMGDNPTAAYLGTLGVNQSSRPAPRRGGVSIGIGGGSFSGGRHGGGGFGGGISVPVTGNRPGELVTTTLTLQLKRRSDNSVVWEGRASSDAQGPAADLPRVVPELAHALLTDFPGPRGQTVRVKTR